jgi:hypothetical protein
LIGHTHYPQSQPYLPLGRVLMRLFPQLGPAADRVFGSLRLLNPLVRLSSGDASNESGSQLLRRVLDSAFKSRYFNSGVSGWHDGVIYAIEITTEGQARLLYFTDEGSEPHEMDWELTPEQPPGSAAAIQSLARSASLQRAQQRMQHAVESLTGALGAGLGERLGVFSRGMDGLVEAVASGDRAAAGGLFDSQPFVLQGAAAAETLQLRLTEFLTRVAQFVVPRPGGSPGESLGQTPGAFPSIAFDVPFSSRQLETLEAVRQQLETAGIVPAERVQQGGGYHLALGWLYAEQHVPYAGSAHEGSADCHESPASTRAANQRAVGALLAWLPLHAELPVSSSPPLALQTNIVRRGTQLRISVEVGPATRQRQPQPEPPRMILGGRTTQHPPTRATS